MAILEELRNHGGEKRILVCDDEHSFLRLCEITLQHAGYTVQTAEDGLDATECLAERIPDLAIVDIVMPRMDGFELVAHIRNLMGLSSLPIVVVSAAATDSDNVNRMTEAGADMVLAKPIRMECLLQAVSGMLFPTVGPRLY
jgi:chemosensory pili system protein ChpA (sensor histidine kinase/response regulator)